MSRIFNLQTSVVFFGLAISSVDLAAQNSTRPVDVDLRKEGNAYFIDLSTTLRLANAQNLDIQIARQKLNEAKANRDSAIWQFFPWLSPGISYRRHDDLIQDISGNIFEVHKQSYAPGATIGAQVDIGDALYKSLAAKQQVKASEFAVESQRQETAFAGVQNYFDLLLAQSAVNVADEAVRISTNYEAQVHHAVEAGITFKGDELRVLVQAQRNQLILQQALEQQRAAAARLAQTLHLDPTIELLARQSELIPLHLVETNVALATLVAQSLASRPERRENQAAIATARAVQKGVVYGPLIPTAGAQFFAGGLGGDSSAGSARFGDQEDLFVGLSWKIGPGGIFDSTRKRAAEARLQIAELNAAKTHDEISRQVVESAIRVNSLAAQLESAKSALEAAEKGLQLAQMRREFAVGVVLENIQAEQDLTRARGDFLKTISEFNKAQYALMRALGKL